MTGGRRGRTPRCALGIAVASAAVVACGTSRGVTPPGEAGDAPGSADASSPPRDGAADATDGHGGAKPDGGVDSAAGGGLHVMAFGAPASPGSSPHYAAVAASGILTGPVVVAAWSSIDKGGGSLDFASLDGPGTMLASYLAAYPGESVSILFEPASDIFKNAATPTDVLTSKGQQICFCSSYNGDTTGVNGCFENGAWNGTPDLTGLPVPFTGAFAARWQGFIGAAIAHLNAAPYASRILYVSFGVSNGGEDIPRCSGPETNLVSPRSVAGLSAAWIANVAAEDKAIAAAHPSFPVVVGTSCLGVEEPPDGSTTNDNCATFSDLEAKTHASFGVGLRITTLQAGDLLAYAKGTPTVSDWAANTASYADVPIVWQTSYESSPTGKGSAMCVRNGSLAALVPFIMKHSSAKTPLRVLEAYYADLEGTYAGAAGFADPCWPAGTVAADPYAPYDTVFKNAVAGF